MCRYVRASIPPGLSRQRRRCRCRRCGQVTCGVSGVDDAEDARVAVLPGLGDGPPELRHVQTPAVFLVQVVVDLHCGQFSQGGRIQRVLWYRYHHAGAGAAFAAHQQLQHGLGQEEEVDAMASRCSR